MEFSAGNIKGETPKIVIGQVVTKPAGSLAKINAKEANKDVVLNFEIPKGDTGDKGDTGTSISQITQTFAVSSDGFNHPTSGWNFSIPARMFGDHLWSKLSIKMSDNTTNDFYIVLPETPAAVTPAPTVPITQTQSGAFKLGFNTFNEPEKELVTQADVSAITTTLTNSLMTQLLSTAASIKKEAVAAAVESVSSITDQKIETYAQSVSPIIEDLDDSVKTIKDVINDLPSEDSITLISEKLEDLESETQKTTQELKSQIANSGGKTKTSLFSFSKKIPAVPKGSPDGNYVLTATIINGEDSYEWRIQS